MRRSGSASSFLMSGRGDRFQHRHRATGREPRDRSLLPATPTARARGWLRRARSNSLAGSAATSDRMLAVMWSSTDRGLRPPNSASRHAAVPDLAAHRLRRSGPSLPLPPRGSPDRASGASLTVSVGFATAVHTLAEQLHNPIAGRRVGESRAQRRGAIADARRPHSAIGVRRHLQAGQLVVADRDVAGWILRGLQSTASRRSARSGQPSRARPSASCGNAGSRHGLGRRRWLDGECRLERPGRSCELSRGGPERRGSALSRASHRPEAFPA